MEGFVTKKSRGKHSYMQSSNWKVRWLELDGSLIRYYKDPLKTIKKGKVRLTQSTLVMTHPDVGNYKNVILVKGAYELVFSADSPESQAAWMRKLVEHINLSPPDSGHIGNSALDVDGSSVQNGEKGKHYSFNKSGLNSVLRKFYKGGKKRKPGKNDSNSKQQDGSDDNEGGQGNRSGSDDDGNGSDSDGGDAAEKVEMVAVAQHPAYARYFKMLAMGLPVTAARNKMMLDKLDPYVLDMSAETMIPLHAEVKPYEAASSKPNFLAGNPFKKPQQVRKKKLFLKAVRQSMIGENSLWATAGNNNNQGPGNSGSGEHDDDIELDEEEFARFFIQKLDNGNAGKDGKRRKSILNRSAANKKKERVACVIDAKRAQNSAIALARIKTPFTTLRDKLLAMDDERLSLSQLEALKEYLPTAEEAEALKKYATAGTSAGAGTSAPSTVTSTSTSAVSTGAEEALQKEMEERINNLGAGERYMYSLLALRAEMSISQIGRRLDCMIYKQRFHTQWLSSMTQIEQLTHACRDIKSSIRLRRVLKVVLKVVNQLSDGGNDDGGQQQQHRGVTLEALCELQNAKTFDQKTTVLQYIVMVISRKDADALQFPEDLMKNVRAAARLQLDALESEKTTLRLGLETHMPLIEFTQKKLQEEAERLVRAEEERLAEEQRLKAEQRRQRKLERKLERKLKRKAVKSLDSKPKNSSSGAPTSEGSADDSAGDSDENLSSDDDSSSSSSGSSESGASSDGDSDDEGAFEDDDEDDEGQENATADAAEFARWSSRHGGLDGSSAGQNDSDDEAASPPLAASAKGAEAAAINASEIVSDEQQAALFAQIKNLDTSLNPNTSENDNHTTENAGEESTATVNSTVDDDNNNSDAVVGAESGSTVAAATEHPSSSGSNSSSNDVELTADELAEWKDSTSIESMTVFDFFASGRAENMCRYLETQCARSQHIYQDIVSYFGEDKEMPCQDFFSTLCRFVQDFINARELVARILKAEQRRPLILSKKNQQQHLQQQPSPEQPIAQPQSAAAKTSALPVEAAILPSQQQERGQGQSPARPSSQRARPAPPAIIAPPMQPTAQQQADHAEQTQETQKTQQTQPTQQHLSQRHRSPPPPPSSSSSSTSFASTAVEVTASTIAEMAIDQQSQPQPPRSKSITPVRRRAAPPPPPAPSG